MSYTVVKFDNSSVDNFKFSIIVSPFVPITYSSVSTYTFWGFSDRPEARRNLLNLFKYAGHSSDWNEKFLGAAYCIDMVQFSELCAVSDLDIILPMMY